MNNGKKQKKTRIIRTHSAWLRSSGPQEGSVAQEEGHYELLSLLYLQVPRRHQREEQRGSRSRKYLDFANKTSSDYILTRSLLKIQSDLLPRQSRSENQGHRQEAQGRHWRALADVQALHRRVRQQLRCSRRRAANGRHFALLDAVVRHCRTHRQGARAGERSSLRKDPQRSRQEVHGGDDQDAPGGLESFWFWPFRDRRVRRNRC